MDNPVQRLLSILDLKKIGQNQFQGESGNSLWQRVFGGHVIAQALVAAQNSVADDRFVHSLHAYFMRPGDPTLPIIYEVEQLRDGKSFSTRAVKAIQKDLPILSFTASFQTDEEGLNYQKPMPKDILGPEHLTSDTWLDEAVAAKAPKSVQQYWNLHRPFIVRPIDIHEYLERKKHKSLQRSWFRLDGNIVQNRKLNAAILAYLSDMTLLDTALLVHGRSVFSPDIQPASLDHAMWFHREFDLDDWLFYDLESPNSSGGRGLAQGHIYSRSGQLVATVAQEGLMRVVKPKDEP